MAAVLPNSVMATRVGATRGSSGSNPSARAGFDTDLIVSQLHNPLYEQAVNGNLFYAYAAAVTVTAVGTVITGLILWNSSTTKNLHLVRASLFVHATSASMTGVALASTATGAQTAAPTSSAAITRQGSTLLGSAGVGTAYTGGTLTTTTSFWPMFHNTAAINTVGEDQVAVNLDGFIVPPATAIHIAALGAASAANAMTIGCLWEEVPILPV